MSKAELRPFEKLMWGRIARQPEARLWALLDERWQALVRHAEDIAANADRGLPYQRHERQAAEELLKLAREIDARTLWVRVAALYALQDRQPRRFASDRAFRFELVRMVRRLSEVNVSRYWNNDLGRTTLVYRDPAPRTVEILGAWLEAAFGAASLRLARADREAEERKQRQQQELHEALREIDNEHP